MQNNKLQFLGRVALILAVAVMVAFSWLRPLDSRANEQIDAGLQRALISFATARALNGVISLAQGTEVTAQFIGGINLSIGEILDPVNDLVEQYSDLMLIASIAFGIQKMLLSIGSYTLISLLLTTTAVIWSVFLFRQRRIPSWLSKLFVVLLMTRFAIPVVAIGSDLVFKEFMAKEYQSSQLAVANASGVNGKMEQPKAAEPATAEPEKKSMFDKLKGTFGKSAAAQPAAAAPQNPQNMSMIEKIKEWWSKGTDSKSSLDNLRQSVEETTKHIINLMVIFVLQTLVIPVVLLWILYVLARGLFERPAQSSN